MLNAVAVTRRAMNKKRKASQPSGNNELKKHRADTAQPETPRSHANPHDNPGVQQSQVKALKQNRHSYCIRTQQVTHEHSQSYN